MIITFKIAYIIGKIDVTLCFLYKIVAEKLLKIISTLMEDSIDDLEQRIKILGYTMTI